MAMATNHYHAISPLSHSIRSSSFSFSKSLAPPIPIQQLIPSLSYSNHPQPPAMTSFTWDDVFRVSGSEIGDPSDLLGFFEKISACNRNIDKQREFLPFVIEDQIVGFVHHGFAGILRNHHDVFVFSPVGTTNGPSSGYVTLQAALRTPTERTDALFPITSRFGAKEFFSLERAAAPYFGIKVYGIQMNGYVERNGEEFLWIAKRSQEKSTFPGMLDHLASGGLPHGISCSENVIKECEEEAGIPRSVSKQSVSFLPLCSHSAILLKQWVVFLTRTLMGIDTREMFSFATT